jgi:hypothetical protein
VKKAVTILILSIFLFNVIGYRYISTYFSTLADESLITRLDDNQYNIEELIEIRVPLNLPYFMNWNQFERCDGQVVVNGQTFNYVARRLVNNEMIYRCIPNTAKDKVNATARAIDNQLHDGAKQKKSNLPHLKLTKPGADYDDLLCTNFRQWPFHTRNTANNHIVAALATGYFNLQTPPPDLA